MGCSGDSGEKFSPTRLCAGAAYDMRAVGLGRVYLPGPLFLTANAGVTTSVMVSRNNISEITSCRG